MNDNNTGKLFIKLSCISIAYFLTIALGTYNSVYLNSKGLTASQTGSITAFLSLLSTVVTPFFGVISDKASSYEKVIRFLVAGSLVTSILIYLLNKSSIFLILALFVLANVIKAPLGSLIENYLIANGDKYKVDYGKTRGLGSLSFSIGCILLGLIIPHTEVVSVFLMMAAVNLLIFVLVNGRVEKTAHTAQKGNRAEIFDNRAFKECLAFSLIIYISTNCTFTFLPYLFNEIGIDSGKVGLAIGYSGLVEVPFLFLFGKLARKGSLKKLYRISGMLFALESSLYFVTDSLWFLIAVVSTIRGIAHGLYVGAGNSYVYQISSEKEKATAMSLYVATGSVAGIVGNIVGGWIISHYTVKLYFLIIGIASALISIWFYREKNKYKPELKSGFKNHGAGNL